ncbi:hypothetical protein BS47DRAFT_1366276 [Hydnum rufescens UP504]|uniref:Uncharacterized protein n=1 Tax=Hydnum rufescens UP504 TaxID=1448309 RepID=A0A9P6ANC8_9AGAM|nr:hypothetical protein BS47DRAFT_1366276 [Hydnum rufescens UP504]
MGAHLFDVMKQIITPKKLSHIMSDNASMNDAAMNELGQLLIGNGISDWDPIENRIQCVLMHSGSPMAHTSFKITTVHRYTHMGNPDEDEEDILELISGMDEPMLSNPFPPCCHDIGIQELELIAYVVTHWGSRLGVLKRVVEQKKAIMQFTCYADDKDGTPKPQGGTPMYCQYTLVERLYIKEEWDEYWVENALQKFQEEVCPTHFLMVY